MVDSTNLPDVDINQIATDLNGKMDRDCLNASDTGNIQMAAASMPSSRYIDLTLGASGTQYTAPADGWVSLRTTGSTAFVDILYDNSFGQNATANAARYSAAVICPVKKDKKFTIAYNGNVSVLSFYYAVGSESEAS